MIIIKYYGYDNNQSSDYYICFLNSRNLRMTKSRFILTFLKNYYCFFIASLM